MYCYELLTYEYGRILLVTDECKALGIYYIKSTAVIKSIFNFNGSTT